MKKSLLVLTAFSAIAAQATILERPTGFRIGQRLTVRPYVSLYYTWDSNVDSSNEQGSYSSINVSPGFTFSYQRENWGIEGGAYYQYHAYTENSDNLNQHSWGQNLAIDWSNSRDGGRGWTLAIRENFQQIGQSDDMMSSGGRGIGRDRMQLQFAGTVQKRFNDRWHADVDVSYYYLDYDNDKDSYAPLYGWNRWTAGAQFGYVASRWTDVFLTANYQGYTQKNDTDLGGEVGTPRGEYIANNSDGVTVHIGIGTHATEKISYRVSGGYSHFWYGGGASSLGGFTYDASAQWRMTDTWNMMVLASSYYSPSETDYGSATRNDNLAWGLAHSMVRNKLTATFDITYRHTQREYCEYASSEVGDDTLTGRFALNYTWNRFVSIFGCAEYQKNFSKGDYLDAHNYTYDYDRWRLSVGLRLTY